MHMPDSLLMFACFMGLLEGGRHEQGALGVM